MIVLLMTFGICSYIHSEGVDSLLYGGADSTLVSYDDLRLTNAKLIELQYEKQINEELKEVLFMDNTIIDSLRTDNDKLNSSLINSNTKCNKIKRQRNAFIIATVITTILAIIGISK